MESACREAVPRATATSAITAPNFEMPLSAVIVLLPSFLRLKLCAIVHIWTPEFNLFIQTRIIQIRSLFRQVA